MQNGWTGLHFAVQIKDATIVHLLIDRGIDINIQTTVSGIFKAYET